MLEFQAKVLKDAKLKGCIDRLRCYANQENRTVSDDDVDGTLDTIIDDLQYVLAAAANYQCNELVNVKTLKRIGKIVSSAPMLSINRMGKPKSHDIRAAADIPRRRNKQFAIRSHS